MRGVWLFVVGLVATSVVAKPQDQVIFAGFDHLLSIEKENLTVTAYDFRRGLDVFSTCDIVARPPLVSHAPLYDWLSLNALEEKKTDDIEFKYLGYEIFMIEDKSTGSYVTRRCRDFRPQLDALPCEALATGKAAMLKHPYKTVWIGNNRVMFIHTRNNTFSVHPFDADVHTGGDAFGFTFGPLFAGPLPNNNNYAEAEFAYVQLPNHGGDLLLVYSRNTTLVKGYRFHGSANNLKEWSFEQVFVRVAPTDTHLITLGDNMIMFYNHELDASSWTVTTDESSGYQITRTHAGSLTQGPDCLTDNATACVLTHGCAWCPSSFTCHPYDTQNAKWCDNNGCTAAALLDTKTAAQAVTLPDCDSTLHEPTGNIVIEKKVEKLLPKDVRLPAEYRDDVGEYANAVVAPSHPLIDNVLGDKVDLSGTAFPNQQILDHNMVASGKVYIPPPPSEAAPCMDHGYSSATAADVAAPESADAKMNTPPQSIKIYTTSPAGEASSAVEEEHCDKAEKETPAKVSVTAPKQSTVLAATQEDFVPRPGQSPEGQEYQPAHTSTRHEEDLMNSDKTPAADLKARWLDPAVESDWSRAPKKISSEVLGFKPKEPQKLPPAPQVIPLPQQAQATHTDATKLMDEGIVADQQGVSSYYTKSGGNDGTSSVQFNSAMGNNAQLTFPSSIEQQLMMANKEIALSENGMASIPIVEDKTPVAIPPAPASEQNEILPPSKPEKTETLLTSESVAPTTPSEWGHL